MAKKAKIVGDKQRVRDGRVENLGRWPKGRWHRPAQDKTSSARSAPRFDPRACPLHRCSFVVVAACSLSRRALSSLACLLRIAVSSPLIAVLILPSFFFALQSSPFFPNFGVVFFSRQRGFLFLVLLGILVLLKGEDNNERKCFPFLSTEVWRNFFIH